MLKHCRPDNLARGHLSILHRSFGRLPKPCVPRGQRTSGGADVGAFPGRAIHRARAPLCAEGRLWVFSPGEPYPGRECLLCRTIYVYWTDVIYSWLKCQLSGDVLHVSDVIYSRLKCQLSRDVLHV